MDHLVNLEADVFDTLAFHGHILVTSMDIEKAYEITGTNRIMIILNEHGYFGDIIAFVMQFVKNRKIIVRIGNILSKSGPIKNGLPTGSVLSVLLFHYHCNYSEYHQ